MGAGGPVPPLGLLYIAAAIRKQFGDRYQFKIYDTGTNPSSPEDFSNLLADFNPHLVGLSSMSCEADLLHRIAGQVKEHDGNTVVIAGGPHTVVVKEQLLNDQNIDFSVIGEGERTIVELLDALEEEGTVNGVAGLAYRKNGEPALTNLRNLIENLDELPFPAWDLLDPKIYAAYSNWNGELKERFYAPLVTTRGCPFHCSYCHNVFGKKVRARSPENVFAEIEYLHHTLGVPEIHIIDDVFNFDPERAKKLCAMIMGSKMQFSFAFPNGLRADIMEENLIDDLRAIGTYKIHYGFETITPRLQRLIRKNLNIPKAVQIINRTAAAGIITGAYFMFGFPTETREEILKTIDFAVASNLDVAYFFKVTPYPGSELYRSLLESGRLDEPESYDDYHFYSVERSCSDIPNRELNELILIAQQRFFLRPGRIWKTFRKAPRKLDFFKKFMNIIALIIQAYIIRKLAGGPGEKNHD